MSYTFAELPISLEAFTEIRDKLAAAGYTSQIVNNGNCVDMHGLAVIPDAEQLKASPVTKTHELYDTFLAQRTKDSALTFVKSLGIIYMSIVDNGSDEFTFRLNEGNVKRHSLERLASFVDAIVGKRLTYARLIAKVPA